MLDHLRDLPDELRYRLTVSREKDRQQCEQADTFMGEFLDYLNTTFLVNPSARFLSREQRRSITDVLAAVDNHELHQVKTRKTRSKSLPAMLFLRYKSLSDSDFVYTRASLAWSFDQDNRTSFSPRLDEFPGRASLGSPEGDTIAFLFFSQRIETQEDLDRHGFSNYFLDSMASYTLSCTADGFKRRDYAQVGNEKITTEQEYRLLGSFFGEATKKEYWVYAEIFIDNKTEGMPQEDTAQHHVLRPVENPVG